MEKIARRLCGVVTVLVTVAVKLCVVSSAPVAMDPSGTAPAPPRGEDVGCFRPLSDVIWGFIVTLLACTVALWGVYKYRASGTSGKTQVVLLGVGLPIVGLDLHLVASVQNVWLLWSYHKSIQHPQYHTGHGQFRKLRSLFSPLTKFPGRILFSSMVILYVLKESSLLQEDWLWSDEMDMEDDSEAMVIGEVEVGKTKDGHYECKELSRTGTIALLLAEVVPEYDKLKFLRGNSGFAAIAIAIQALGYIYAVAFRRVKELPVAPLEVVGLILNIMLLIEVSVYSVHNPCHRPLVIYMNSERDEKLCNTLQNVNERYVPSWIGKVSNAVLSVIVFCLCGVIVYFFFVVFKFSNPLVVVPLIIFVVATILYLLVANFELFKIDTPIVPLLNVVAYTWALVVTIVYWKSEHFDIRAELLNWSQLIPFIG